MHVSALNHEQSLVSTMIVWENVEMERILGVNDHEKKTICIRVVLKLVLMLLQKRLIRLINYIRKVF